MVTRDSIKHIHAMAHQIRKIFFKPLIFLLKMNRIFEIEKGFVASYAENLAHRLRIVFTSSIFFSIVI